MAKSSRGANDYLKMFFDSLQSPAFVVDLDGVITNWNRALAVKSVPVDDAVGRRLLDVFPNLDEEVAGINWARVIFENVLEEGRRINAPRCRFADLGPNFVFDISVLPVRDARGRVVAAGLVANDVTDKLSSEEFSIREAKTTSLAELGAAFAHEIKNPLNSISMNLQMLVEQIENGAPDVGEMSDTAKLVLGEIGRVTRIIDDFLTFSRLPRSVPKIADSRIACEKAVNLLREEARRKGILIETRLGDLPDVLIDSDHLFQAIYNVVLNAIQALDRNGHILIVGAREDDQVVFRIADDGPGISEENLKHVFDIFYSTKKNGTGLGLTIASRLLRNMNGGLSISSTAGKGTVATITLPLKIIS